VASILPKSLEQVPPTQGEAPQAPRMRRRRCRRGGNGEGVLEHRELPQRGPGRSPIEKRIWCILNVTEHFWLHGVVNQENSILHAEMQYAMKTGQQTCTLVTARTNICDISRINHIITKQ